MSNYYSLIITKVGAVATMFTFYESFKPPNFEENLIKLISDENRPGKFLVLGRTKKEIDKV